ncbi:MLO-like protein 1 isoform X2 [Prosopis cineraria]|uniref:MLO-like protein 1 isoform X2 n=1 Tax=Prosopis cineraria TaxID=364024 RepID=UPI0024101E1B|nr:MLO-like protein 1 isoform X2 [Prosopis cineraria]
MSGGGEEETTLEHTPTWVVALVCTVIVAVSLAAERFLHCGGKFLRKRDQKPLYEALQKIKEGSNGITEIRVPAGLTRHMLPCNPDRGEGEESITSTSHFQSFFSFPGISGTARRLLAGASSSRSYCVRKNKVPLLSVEAIHHLRIFIFVLALVHVTYCVLTVFFGGLKIRQWKHWEDSIAKDNYETQKDHSCSPA